MDGDRCKLPRPPLPPPTPLAAPAPPLVPPAGTGLVYTYKRASGASPAIQDTKEILFCFDVRSLVRVFCWFVGWIGLAVCWRVHSQKWPTTMHTTRTQTCTHTDAHTHTLTHARTGAAAQTLRRSPRRFGRRGCGPCPMAVHPRRAA